MKLSILLIAILLWPLVFGHGDDDEALSPKVARAQKEATSLFKRTCKRASACVLQKEVTEGPYYYDTQLIRENITEGHQGLPTILNITVVDVNTCEPIANAAVDVWHCNASGVYSHFNNAQNLGGTTSTFLRGIQLSDADGVAQVSTIFPGWYTGRTTHIHIKVHIGGTINGSLFTGGNVLHTGQLFFDDDLVDEVNQMSPYSSKSQSSRINLASDNIYQSAGSIAILDLSYIDSSLGVSGGIVGSVVLGVDTTSTTTTGNSATSTPPMSTSTTGSASTTTGATTTSSSSDTSDDNFSNGSIFASFLYKISVPVVIFIIFQ